MSITVWEVLSGVSWETSDLVVETSASALVWFSFSKSQTMFVLEGPIFLLHKDFLSTGVGSSRTPSASTTSWQMFSLRLSLDAALWSRGCANFHLWTCFVSLTIYNWLKRPLHCQQKYVLRDSVLSVDMQWCKQILLCFTINHLQSSHRVWWWSYFGSMQKLRKWRDK